MEKRKYRTTLFRRRLFKVLRDMLQFFNIGLVRLDDLNNLKREANRLQFEMQKIKAVEYDKEFIKLIDPKDIFNLSDLIPKSRSSELHQDVFALVMSELKTDGFFVEFGATDGIGGSNTLLLEKDFNWRGILVEPARIWHRSLKQNRPLAYISTKCVWEASGVNLIFAEVPDSPELSTAFNLKRDDLHANSRKHSKNYVVESISLIDLLREFNAPKEIDFLSMDTEGSEFLILKKFNFEEFSFKVISCEHNFTENRDKVRELLEKVGYKRVYENLSLYDDWYIRGI
jgi:FkbM family methyltransferase